MSDEQMQLDLEGGEDLRIFFENTTLTSDVVLGKAMGQFEDVFIIGVTEGSLEYRGSNGDVRFWVYALQRAQDFLMRNH